MFGSDAFWKAVQEFYKARQPQVVFVALYVNSLTDHVPSVTTKFTNVLFNSFKFEDLKQNELLKFACTAV